MTDTLHQLYATPILQSYFDVPHRVLEFVKSQEVNFHNNGYMSHEQFLDCDEMYVVKRCITEKVKEYFYDYCGFDKEVEPELISSWINLHKKGNWAHTHFHANSVVSFAWYLVTSPTSGDFVTYHPHKLFGSGLDFNHKIKNSMNNDSYGFSPERGDLIIFPSDLHHSVNENKDDIERISIAGNYWMRGSVNSGNVKVKL